MASLILNGGFVHNEEAATLLGLARVIETMRHEDIEKAAALLERMRSGPVPGKARLRGEHLAELAKTIKAPQELAEDN